MKKFSTILKATKVLMINLMIASLLQNPFISNAMAADTSKGIDAQSLSNLSGTVLGVYGNYLNQKQQMIQQQMMSTQNQQLMSQMSPTCRKPDGSACFATPAKMFPECTLPASMSNMPTNVCPKTPTMNPMQISNMLTYESIAQGWVNYYDQMKNKASNATYPVGLRCLEDKQKAMDSQLTEMVNSLQRLQDRLKQDSQIFRDNNKKLLTDMDTANAELFGSDKGDLKSKTSDFSKFFSQSCQTVIGKDALAAGKSKGLNGILQEKLSPINKSATDFSSNKSVIENDIRRETDKIAQTIKDGGVADFLEKSYIPQSDEAAKTFGAISGQNSQIAKQSKEFMTAKARIDKTLAEVGYTAPALDSKFDTDSAEFMASSGEFFKKKYVNDCVTGNSAGIAIPVEDILKSLQQRSTNSEGTARNDYRVALKRVLDSDAMIDDKMAQIKQLEADYPGMTVTYKDAGQSRVIESPYSLFMKTIDKCQQRYTQDDQMTAGGTKGGSAKISYQKKVERAQAALQELKNLNDGFASKVTGAILSQVLDCGGSTAKSGSCTEDTLNSSSANFCISHATQCANEIQGCYAEANNQIQSRKTKMENLAKAYNKNAYDMIARTNSLYEQQKAAVTAMTKLIQQKIPGTNFEIPADMFVPSPELSKDKYGVEMAGNGDLTALLDGPNSMPKKIDALKLMFQNQKKAVDQSIGEYKQEQADAMEKESQRWGQLANECKGAADSSMNALAKYNEKGQKDQAAQDAKVGSFCKKYYSIASNPSGSCGKAKDLADIADEVQARLNGKALQFSEQYAAACDGYMNESGSTSTDCTYKDGKDKELCLREKESNLNKSKPGSAAAASIKPSKLCPGKATDDKKFIANVASTISSEAVELLKDQDDLGKAIEKINDNKKVKDGEFLTGLNDLLDGVEGSNICEKIAKATKVNDDDKKANDAYESAKKLSDAVKLVKDKYPTKEAKKIDIDGKELPNPKPENIESLENALTRTQAEVDKTKTAKEAAEAKATANATYNELLNSLAAANTPTDPNSKAAQLDKVIKIGQQAEGPCDMQSNSNLTKGGMFDMPGFNQQQGMLGSAR